MRAILALLALIIGMCVALFKSATPQYQVCIQDKCYLVKAKSTPQDIVIADVQESNGSILLQTAPTITPQQIDDILASYGSPATGTGQTFYDLGVQYGINPAIALAFYIHESSAGTAGVAVETRSIGNIICAGYATCSSGFRSYSNWDDSIGDWYRLIMAEYIEGRGHTTIADVVPVYCPIGDGCDSTHYIDTVESLVYSWSGVQGTQEARSDTTDMPRGNPLGDAATVMTQGYDVGSHTPAAIWGGVDLAIDSNGDDEADPRGTTNAPIYATHSGIVRAVPNSWPAGNYLSIENDEYRTAYAHLSAYAVGDGQQIAQGQLVGYVGSTGQTTGPHLHYEVWHNNVNVNPMEYL
jgi:hypothetical protein